MPKTETKIISRELFREIEKAPTNQKAMQILSKNDYPIGFIGGFDSANWGENEVTFLDRGVTGRIDSKISAKHYRFIAK